MAKRIAFIPEAQYANFEVGVNLLKWEGMGEDRDYQPSHMKTAWMLKGIRPKKETEVNKEVQEVQEVKEVKDMVQVQAQQHHALRKFTLSPYYPLNMTCVIHPNICLYLSFNLISPPKNHPPSPPPPAHPSVT